MILKLQDRKIVKKFLEDYGNITEDLPGSGIRVLVTEDLSGFWRWILEATGDQTENLPFWSIVWPGGRALAKYILEHSTLFEGKTVFELGCGNGFASIAAAHAGAKVTACDHDPRAIYVAQKNARLSDACSIRFEVSDPLDEQIVRDGYDIYLMGDMFYEEHLANAGLQFMRKRAAEGSFCIASDPGRIHRPKTAIHQLQKYRIPVPVQIEGVTERDAEILQIQPAPRWNR